MSLCRVATCWAGEVRGGDGVDVFWGGGWGVGLGAYLSKRCASAVLWGALLPVSRLLISIRGLSEPCAGFRGVPEPCLAMGAPASSNPGGCASGLFPHWRSVKQASAQHGVAGGRARTVQTRAHGRAHSLTHASQRGALLDTHGLARVARPQIHRDARGVPGSRTPVRPPEVRTDALTRSARDEYAYA